MPRKARKKSETGIYHIMLRGINGQAIFEDKEDNEKFIQVIGDYREVCEYNIFAYCLMKNHVHLLMKEGKEDLGIVFRRIGAKYVHWYNKKYKRTGHLFQDRYKSEPVEDENYFLTVLRYIHQNPLKAGIVNAIEVFPWSSYGQYIGKNGICDTKFTLRFFAEDERQALYLFKEYNKSQNDDECLSNEIPVAMDDMQATRIIENIIGDKNPRLIKEYERRKIDRVMRILKARGLSIRQIERLTGVSFSIIRRA